MVFRSVGHSFLVSCCPADGCSGGEKEEQFTFKRTRQSNRLVLLAQFAGIIEFPARVEKGESGV